MTVIEFPVRKAVGDAHEQRVRAELERRGWTVAEYGQGVLPDEIRRPLGRTNSRLRFDPDFIAARGSRVVMVDAKSSMRGENADNFTISRKALDAHMRLWVETGLPMLYVFANLGVASPADVLRFCGLKTTAEAGAYVSFSARMPGPFDATFGAAYLQAA
jgi:hypothetical protein